MQMKAAFLFATVVGPAAAVIFGGAPLANTSVHASTTRTETAADVAKARRKLEAIATALDGMLSAKEHGSLAEAKVAPVLQHFVTELRATLKDTASMKDSHQAMNKLRNAQAGIADVMSALNKQQEELMHEDATEETNLLLGVLMTRRKEPIEKQLEVLQSPDFKGLPVSKALVAKHDKTPLFKQVAAYMDAHGVAADTNAADSKAKKLEKTVAYFESRAQLMEREEAAMKKAHERRVAQVEELMKKGNKTSASVHRMELEMKHADRQYKKMMRLHMQQTKVMRDVVSALKRGDAKALQRAREVLRKQMQAAQARTGDFLHLLQMGHSLERRDCPFCVAQCIGKCHDGGTSYAQCMTQCAEAGQ